MLETQTARPVQPATDINPGIGKSPARVEDPVLLTGRGRFVADLRDRPYLEAVVIRSPHPHARVVEVRGPSGTVSARELGPANRPIPLLVPHPRLQPVMPPPLAAGEVHYVGQPVAVVVGRNRYQAEDLADAVRVDYRPLPAALDPTGAEVPAHLEKPDNQVAEMTVGTGDHGPEWDAAWRQAALVVTLDLAVPRLSPQPLEPRAVAAYVDEWGRLQMFDTTQAPHTARKILCVLLGWPEERVRVVAPDVGGGFGAKNRFYPEEFLAPWLAIRLGRPVRWVGDRREDLLATYQERGQVHRARLAADAAGRILAVADRFWQDNGAYTPFGLVVPYTTAVSIPGPYRVPRYRAAFSVVLTNKVPVAPYRGAGRPQAVFVMERLLDALADRLGLDRCEVRRRNLLTPADMPYRPGLVARNGRPMRYDGGDYLTAFNRALAALGERAAPGPGWRIGIAAAPYVEMAALGSYEEASVRLDIEGHLEVRVGSASQGQGHATTLAQVAAETFSAEWTAVRVVAGDTDRVANGVGTYASRTAVAAGNAVALAAAELKRRCLAVAARLLGAAPDRLGWEPGWVVAEGRRLRWAELARATCGITLEAPELADGGEDTRLEVTVRYRPGDLTFAYGSHAVAVAVDPATGRVRLLGLAVCHDGGRLIHPRIVEGQLAGGVAQGLGAALTEAVAYDQTGQPLTTTYLDYLLPQAADLPEIVWAHLETPSDANPLGVKGIAEGGALPGPALLASAIEAAVGGRLLSPPFTPQQVWALGTTRRRLEGESVDAIG